MLLPLLFILLIDIYAYQAFRTVLLDAPALKTIVVIAYWGISLSLYVAAILALRNGFDLSNFTVKFVFGAIICLFAAKVTITLFMLSDDLFRFTKWIVAQFTPSINSPSEGNKMTRLAFLSKAGLVAGGTMLSLFVYGMVRTAYNFTIRRVTVHLEQLPAQFKGLKVVQISDMHLGSFASTEPIAKAVEMINELEADIIFFTGDLVNSKAAEAMPYQSILASLKAKIGIYSSLGNHDYYGSENDLRQIIQFHKDCGWNILLNEHAIIEVDNTQIGILGVENWGRSRHFPKVGDLNKALKGCENTSVKLLLSHDPSHWDAVVSQEFSNIDLTFSGHTHGFQMGVEIPELKIKFSPSQFAYKQWGGLYNRGKQYLYVNRGLGFIGFHGRVGIPPEITLMDIKGAKA
jgi:predicted MPP superfamily phosphohydrolase